MTLTRRRFLTVTAAALAVPHPAAAGAARARWRGVALGAPASVLLAGVGPQEARPVFARLEAALSRLEGIFSLYRDDSAISRLNRAGHLPAPPPEMLEVLTLARRLHRGSGGAFDPTVQPLWQALATGGTAADARGRVGMDGLRFDTREIGFARPGMALSLNGIAQGFVTDTIAALLKDHGFGRVLVDIGEIAALGHNRDGMPWQAGISDGPGHVVQRVALRDRALATSAPGGTVLPGGQGHILHPAGRAPRQSLVSVSADRAVLADGLSTALCLLDEGRGRRLAAGFAGARVEHIAPA